MSGDAFVAGPDLREWRGPVRVALVVGGGVTVVVGVGAAVGLVAWGWLGLAVVGAGGLVAWRVGRYVAQRRRRHTSFVVDGRGVTVPTAQGPAVLGWEAVREVVHDGRTLRVRVRAGVTPGSPGVSGLHQRDVWPIASGPGLPVDSRLFDRSDVEMVAAVHRYSGGRLGAVRV